MTDDFTTGVLEYYEESGRSFFWREQSLNEFEWLLTELLLKRTSAQTVHNHGGKVLKRFSTPEEVLSTGDDELVNVLEPFGLYNRRSKNLQQVCEVLVRDYDGQIPDTREALLSISGVGQYIADAFLCFARREPLLVLDTNTARVAKEVFSIEPADDLRLDNNIRPTIEPYVPESSPREFNWGLIDLGTELRDGNSTVLSEYLSFRD